MTHPAVTQALAQTRVMLDTGLAHARTFARWIGPQPGEKWHALMQMAAPKRINDDGSPLTHLDSLGESYPLPTWQPLARAAMLAVTLFIVWANFARLDEVTIANGEVVPEGRVKSIQHLEGGVIRDILVQDGSMVKMGDALLQIDLAATSMNREELQVRLDGLMLLRARLESELSGKALDFPPEEAKRQPTLLEAEIRNHEARAQSLKATLSVMQDQQRQRSAEVHELESKQRSLNSSLRLARERFDMSKELMKSGLTARMEHVQLQGQMEELEGQIETIRASIPRAQAGVAEAKSRMEEEQARFNRTARTELGDAELSIARTRELLSQASDQQRRTQVTSPIDGIVKNLRATTIGGVVKAGDVIMEIVPLNERLQIDAKLSPMDRGYVQMGQRATVKVTAFDYTTYGGLEGEVVLVAPDTTIGPDNNAYYRVVVQTDKAWLGDDSSKHLISAGMQATVDIHTGTRSVMHYLVKPVLKLRHEAFRER